MHIIFVSQCTKNAKKTTRNILDNFAQRIGDNTWKANLTEEGLQAVYVILRKYARKNTSVICHRVSGKKTSQVMWVVGKKVYINSDGGVCTKTSLEGKAPKYFQPQSYCNTDNIMKLFVQMSSLFHDLGKCSEAFQDRLARRLTEKNLFRHEWLSLRLFFSFINDMKDTEWLEKLATDSYTEEDWTRNIIRDDLIIDDNALDKYPFREKSNIATVLGWLIVSHHRLPIQPNKTCDGQDFLKINNSHYLQERILNTVTHRHNEQFGEVTESNVAEKYWKIVGLPVKDVHWRCRVAKVAKELLREIEQNEEVLHTKWHEDSFVSTISRAMLQLADHHYSSSPGSDYYRTLESNKVGASSWANTDNQGRMKQSIVDHHLGVEREGRRLMCNLGSFVNSLRKSGGSGSKVSKREKSSSKFSWQNEVEDVFASLSDTANDTGLFAVNVASTGYGKTLANIKALKACNKDGYRITYTNGLRDLAQQTKTSLSKYISIKTDVGLLVGGQSTEYMYNYYNKEEENGSESANNLVTDGALYSGPFYPGYDNPFRDALRKDITVQKLLDTPILSCTIDHLMPATESTRGGRQIAPLLRIMSSDIIIDEIDDFSLGDQPALGRLVYTAGFLGSKVIVSSATLTQHMIDGLFSLYYSGRQLFNKHLGIKAETTKLIMMGEHGVNVFDANPDNISNHSRAYLDEVIKNIEDSNCNKIFGGYINFYSHKSTEQPKTEGELYQTLAELVRDTATDLHKKHHQTHKSSDTTISFGLMRFSNINAIIQTVKKFAKLQIPDDFHFHIQVYHSGFPLAARAEIENILSTALNRKDPAAIWDNENVKKSLSASKTKHNIFLVFGSPVVEVGKDHDYDWIILDPSSIQSIIQTVGRLRRHRQNDFVDKNNPNVYILSRKINEVLKSNGISKSRSSPYSSPGYDTGTHGSGSKYFDNKSSPRANRICYYKQYDHINSVARLKFNDTNEEGITNLLDLEHFALKMQFSKKMSGSLNAMSVLNPGALLTGDQVKTNKFRKKTSDDTCVLFIPQDNGTINRYFFVDGDNPRDTVDIKNPHNSWINMIDTPIDPTRRIKVFVSLDLPSLLTKHHANYDSTLSCSLGIGIAKRSGTNNAQRYTYCNLLGLHW